MAAYLSTHRHEQRGWRRLDTSAVFSIGLVVVYLTIGAVRGTSSGARRRSKVAAVLDRADASRSPIRRVGVRARGLRAMQSQRFPEK